MPAALFGTTISNAGWEFSKLALEQGTKADALTPPDAETLRAIEDYFGPFVRFASGGQSSSREIEPSLLTHGDNPVRRLALKVLSLTKPGTGTDIPPAGQPGESNQVRAAPPEGSPESPQDPIGESGGYLNTLIQEAGGALAQGDYEVALAKAEEALGLFRRQEFLDRLD